MGSLDSNGVWTYDGTDAMVPHAAYSNLLATSVSNALADLRDDLTPDVVNWTSTGVTAGTGLSLDGVAYKVDSAGNVHWRGALYGTAPTQGLAILNFPADISPTARWSDIIVGLNSVATVYGGYASGALTSVYYRNMVAGTWAGTSPVGMSLVGLSWPIV